ncbi:general transcription factor 3C polypeptide 5 [Battus philenor]|uniref:general transcription factor 3C polypeptide 5 n=1 Tax=Battus philenor TaxID=42288 RepID=UPI0035D0CFB9
MDSSNLSRDLVCVLFPSIVKNEDKAVQCLGGPRGISQAYSQPTKKRLGLSFQPENPFVKKTFADCKKTSGVLLKVKIKKVNIDGKISKQVTSTSLLGSVKIMYKFEAMCDFQYLPVSSEGAQQPQCLLEKIVPSGVDTFDFLLKPSPLFIVPSNFTRFDKPINYNYTDKKLPGKEKDIYDDHDNIHHRVRTERGTPFTRYTFNLVDDLASEPNAYYVKQMDIKKTLYPPLEQEYQTVQKLFEERPIWSLNLIKFHTKIRLSSLKIIMPCLAIYMKDGPWRMLWVRFGYDPRKEPGARIYQTLDFRLRHTAGVHSMVMTRDKVVHYKKAVRVRQLRSERDEPQPPDDVSEGAVRFRPGMAPSQRQIFYQYCDVDLPEVEEILAAEPPSGYMCHEKRGWLPPNTDHICRDHIFRYVKQTLLATHNADLKLEQGSLGSSDEDSNSDDDETSIPANETDDVLSTNQ